jgi:hypothetical protein
MPPGILIASSLPKYVMIDVPSKFIRKSSMILNVKLPSPAEISVRFVFFKAPSPIATTVGGMQIDERDEQPENACASILEILDPASNATLESALHFAKQDSQSTSTDDGMEIDESDEQE